ncbi:MAG: zf-TFIIB domain-containing protein [Cyanobacteriota bacterium]|nr:zf-TFIIB domain-containing protein [Cyanobacteriota bacterium]
MNPITICPKCAGRLEQVVCAGIEVDRCLDCQGMWFDSLEAETLKAVKGSETLDIGNPETGTQLNKITEDVLCPRCQAKMMRMVDIDQHCIWYEKCPTCQGVWLDAGEFKNFKENFQGQGILGQTRKVFRRKRQ